MLHVKFGSDRTYGSKVIDIFLSHRKCITGTPKLGFLGILGVKTLNFIFIDPKRHYLAQKHVFWRIPRENRSSGAGCTRVQEPQKKIKNTTEGVYFTYMPGKNPSANFYQNWQFITTPRRNQPQQVWSRNIERLLICGGPKFRSSHLLRTSILQTGSRYRGSPW